MFNKSQGKPIFGFSRGFNLIELLMALALATIVFMASVQMFVKQSEVMSAQGDLIDMNREARFALEHLRQDLTALGSNATPNSEVDTLVCPKPSQPLHALQLSIDDSYQMDATLDPFVQPVSIKLFGSLDVKTRWATAAIDSTTVKLLDDGTLPANQADWDVIFSPDRYLRLGSADGTMMYFAIASSNFATKTVGVVGTIPRQGDGHSCGYLGLGANYTVDVQNFVRYRIIEDNRPGAPRRADGKLENSLLVRERLGLNGVTIVAQTILAENAVDLGVYDMLMDIDPAPQTLKILYAAVASDVVQSGGSGVLGYQAGAKPEALRSLTVKVTVRSTWPVRTLVHVKRDRVNAPLETWQVADDGRGTYPTITLAGRIAMPTMMSRNL
jgi:prepilin-type N-terminal cleavage/methylation domain-containing protein